MSDRAYVVHTTNEQGYNQQFVGAFPHNVDALAVKKHVWENEGLEPNIEEFKMYKDYEDWRKQYEANARKTALDKLKPHERKLLGLECLL